MQCNKFTIIRISDILKITNMLKNIHFVIIHVTSTPVEYKLYYAFDYRNIKFMSLIPRLIQLCISIASR